VAVSDKDRKILWGRSGNDVRRILAIERLLTEPLLHDYDIPTPYRLFARHLLVAERGPDGPDRVVADALAWYVEQARSALAAWRGRHPPADHGPEMADLIRRSGRVFLAMEIENLAELLVEACALGRPEEFFALVFPVVEYLAHDDGKDLVLQSHFVMLGVSALVVGLLGAVLVASAPVGPGPGHDAVDRRGDQVCQETLGFAQREWDEAAARAFGAIAAVTAR
jgi:hypothetical protein